MAKADLRKAERGTVFGKAVTRTRQLMGLSLKEFAAALDRDPRQVARWEAGTEHAHADVIFAVEAARLPLIQALAESLTEDVIEIRTQITLKQKVG